METPVSLDSLIRKARGLRWKAIIGSGAMVAALTYLLGFLAIIFYIFSVRTLAGDQASDSELNSFARALVFGAFPVLQMALTLVAARLVSLWAAERFVAHGLLLGISSGVFGQIIGLQFAPFTLGDAVGYSAFALLGGYLGGRWGKATHENREALYRVSQGIGSSSSPQEILAAVGEELTRPDVRGLALWGVDDYGEDTSGLVPLASWSTDEKKSLEAGDLSRMLSQGGLTERDLNIPEASPSGEPLTVMREINEDQGKVSVLILSLDSPDGSRVGMLAVAFGRRRRAARLARSTTRAYQTIGPQISLALENMRLLEEAQRAGRETGVRDERQRLAHEIHDTLAQGFNSIVINLETMEKRLPPDAEAALGDLDLARSTARESLAEARRLVWALRPQALDRHSMPEAIGMLTERWSAENDAAAGVSVVGSPRQLAPEVEAAMLRTAQETLSNVRKHARADRVMLTLSYMSESVVLDARDDGIGFDPEETSREVRTHDAGGFGLRAMRERISQLGGSVVVESELGEGTSMAVELPYERPEKRDKATTGDTREASNKGRRAGIAEELR